MRFLNRFRRKPLESGIMQQMILSEAIRIKEQGFDYAAAEQQLLTMYMRDRELTGRTNPYMEDIIRRLETP